MNIRRAEEKDIPRIIELLKQVLQIHADIRPDIFIPGTTKYTTDELVKMIDDDKKPISVSNNTVPFKSLYIDDLCVDKEQREKHIGEALFDYVKKEAKRMDCYEVTLNVWTGNTPAEKFYEKMGLKTKKRMMEYIL